MSKFGKTKLKPEDEGTVANFDYNSEEVTEVTLREAIEDLSRRIQERRQSMREGTYTLLCAEIYVLPEHLWNIPPFRIYERAEMATEATRPEDNPILTEGPTP